MEIATLVMRRGAPLAIRGVAGELALVRAAEGIGPGDLTLLKVQSGADPALTLSAQRARALGAGDRAGTVVVLHPIGEVDATDLHGLIDPLASPGARPVALARFQIEDARTSHIAAVKLAKLAGLLPAALVAMVPQPPEDLPGWAAERGLPVVAVEDVLLHEERAGTSLRPVGRARVPLRNAEDAQLVAFRSGSGSTEHVAVIIGHPQPDQPVLTRLHSECFTGDLLGSLRCDCGDQLRGAIEVMAAAGSGILLYLAQEGRGIGLVNKLRAYALQDRGFDTIDANRLLGFAADERVYRPAAEMLRQLGFTTIRLMTNNPEKLTALALCGITIVERVPLAFPSNAHNQAYLRTKAVRSGHHLEAIIEGPPAGRVRVSS